MSTSERITLAQVSPEMLDQLAAASGLSDEARCAVDRTITVLLEGLSYTSDAIVYKRGAPEEVRDVPQPSLPEDPFSVYVLANTLGKLANGEHAIDIPD